MSLTCCSSCRKTNYLLKSYHRSIRKTCFMIIMRCFQKYIHTSQKGGLNSWRKVCAKIYDSTGDGDDDDDGLLYVVLWIVKCNGLVWYAQVFSSVALPLVRRDNKALLLFVRNKPSSFSFLYRATPPLHQRLLLSNTCMSGRRYEKVVSGLRK